MTPPMMQEIILHQPADVDDELGQRRQRLAAEHVLENLLELRHDEHEQEAHDRHRDDQHDDRVEHGRHDLVLDLLRLFLELGQADEHQFQHAADLAGLDHVDVELVENLRVLRQPFGERAAALHRVAELGDGRLEHRVALLFFEHRQPAQQRQAGVDERRQLPGEDHQDLLLDRLVGDVRAAFLATAGAFDARLGHRAALFLAALRRGPPLPSSWTLVGKNPCLPQLADGVVGVRGFDQADGLLSAGIQGDVIKFRHSSRGVVCSKLDYAAVDGNCR